MRWSVLQRLYARSAREVRRLAAVARSPVYSQFGSVLEGAAVIRGMNAQLRMCTRNLAHLEFLQRADYTGAAGA